MVRRGRPTVEIKLSAEERKTLQRWAQRHSSAQALALRCKIVLACAEGGRTHVQIADELGCNPWPWRPVSSPLARASSSPTRCRRRRRTPRPGRVSRKAPTDAWIGAPSFARPPPDNHELGCPNNTRPGMQLGSVSQHRPLGRPLGQRPPHRRGHCCVVRSGGAVCVGFGGGVVQIARLSSSNAAATRR